MPFFVVRKRSLLPKVPIFETKKMALRVAKSKFQDHFYSSNIPQIRPVWLLFHEFITFGRDFGHISILSIFGLACHTTNVQVCLNQSLFLWSENSHFCQKCPSLRPKKWHFWWQNQNSKTTFIVQTFPKYCRKGFYFMKLSLLSPILAKFQFC